MEIPILMPDPSDLQLKYIENQGAKTFPFWSKIWPASIALANFIQQNPEWVTNKNILELAAGLGLPSLCASPIADSVICSDYDEDAVAFIKENILLNKASNVTAALINWAQIPEKLEWDVLLMSDINYNPEDFLFLISLLKKLIHQGKTIILSTPQRLIGKPFIEALLAFCILNEEICVNNVYVSILILSK